MGIQPHVPYPQSARHGRGFSLIEAMVALAVMSIGLAIGVPSFKSLQSRQQTVALTNQLLGHMASARSNAITRRQATLICPTRGDGQCRNDSDWSEGWMMFHDPDGNRQPDLPEEVLQVEVPRRSPQFSISSTNGRPLLRYSSSGHAGGSNLTLTICGHNEIRNLIRINNTGRPRIDRTQNGKPCPT
jgi:type IV fimbrial biogenesis protein FimT